MEEAAKLYAKAKWDEACEAQKASCINHYGANLGAGVISLTHAPKPEFKP
jgi:hypothetical protein